MRTLFFTVVLGVTVSLSSFAQSSSCCDVPTPAKKAPSALKATKSKTTATLTMAKLAADPAFQRLHDEPLPFVFQGGKGKSVSIKAADGTTCLGYEIPAPTPTKQVVFVFQEWWGLNDYIKQEAEKIAAALGMNIIALDLYDGKIATTRDSAARYMQSTKRERVETIIKTFAGYVGADAKIGTIGWCFGGMWSLQSSIILGKQALACVMYYGSPELNEDRLKTLQPPVLGIFGSQDNGIKVETVQKFEAAMKKTGKSVEIKMYDAVHAFANPSNPKYNKQFADEAHQLAVTFLKKNLR